MLLSGQPLKPGTSLRVIISAAIAVACIMPSGRANSLSFSKIGTSRVRQLASSSTASRAGCCWYNSSSTSSGRRRHDASLSFLSSASGALVGVGGSTTRRLSLIVGFVGFPASSSPRRVCPPPRRPCSQALWEKAMMLVPPNVIMKVSQMIAAAPRAWFIAVYQVRYVADTRRGRASVRGACCRLVDYGHLYRHLCVITTTVSPNGTTTTVVLLYY